MANIVTIIRIILSILLIVIKPFSNIFLLLYSLCGISDILDGYIARKTNTQSDSGAKLDTIADLIFFIIIGIKIIPYISLNYIYIIIICIIAIIKLSSIVINELKYRKFAILHTYGNKITGLTLFIMPYLIGRIEFNYIFYSISIIAFIASIEELVISIKSKELNRDIKHISKTCENGK